MSDKLNAVAIKVRGFWTCLKVRRRDYPQGEFVRWIIFTKEAPSILEYNQKGMLNRFSSDDVKYKMKIINGLGIEDDVNENEVALWEVDFGDMPGALKVSDNEYHQQELINHSLVQGAFVRAMADPKENLGFAITDLIEIRQFSRCNDKQYTVRKEKGKAPEVIYSSLSKDVVDKAKERVQNIEKAIVASGSAQRDSSAISQHTGNSGSNSGSVAAGIIFVAILVILALIIFH